MWLSLDSFHDSGRSSDDVNISLSPPSDSRTKTPGDQSNLWISGSPKADSMEVWHHGTVSAGQREDITLRSNQSIIFIAGCLRTGGNVITETSSSVLLIPVSFLSFYQPSLCSSSISPTSSSFLFCSPLLCPPWLLLFFPPCSSSCYCQPDAPCLIKRVNWVKLMRPSGGGVTAEVRLISQRADEAAAPRRRGVLTDQLITEES